MPFPFMLLLNLILYVLTTFVVSLLPNSLWFHLISAGTITTAFMMDPSGAGGDDHPSSSFFEGLSDWVQNPAEPGEEINSQPSQGVGQRLPGSSSPGISGESLFRDLEQPSREPAPNIPPVEPPVEEQVEVSDLKLRVQLFLSAFSERSPRTDVVKKVIDALGIDAADAEKRLKIGQVIENLNQPQIRQSLRTPAKAGDELVKIMRGWDDVH